MKIKAKRGTFIIDKADFDLISAIRWYVCQSNLNFYVLGRHDGKIVQLHRFLLNPPSDKEIDHINGNGLDNRRANLRICSHKENCQFRREPQQRAFLKFRQEKRDAEAYRRYEEAGAIIE